MCVHAWLEPLVVVYPYRAVLELAAALRAVVRAPPCNARSVVRAASGGGDAGLACDGGERGARVDGGVGKASSDGAAAEGACGVGADTPVDARTVRSASVEWAPLDAVAPSPTASGECGDSGASDWADVGARCAPSPGSPRSPLAAMPPSLSPAAGALTHATAGWEMTGWETAGWKTTGSGAEAASAAHGEPSPAPLPFAHVGVAARARDAPPQPSPSPSLSVHIKLPLLLLMCPRSDAPLPTFESHADAAHGEEAHAAAAPCRDARLGADGARCAPSAERHTMRHGGLPLAVPSLAVCVHALQLDATAGGTAHDGHGVAAWPQPCARVGHVASLEIGAGAVEVAVLHAASAARPPSASADGAARHGRGASAPFAQFVRADPAPGDDACAAILPARSIIARCQVELRAALARSGADEADAAAAAQRREGSAAGAAEEEMRARTLHVGLTVRRAASDGARAERWALRQCDTQNDFTSGRADAESLVGDGGASGALEARCGEHGPIPVVLDGLSLGVLIGLVRSLAHGQAAEPGTAASSLASSPASERTHAAPRDSAAPPPGALRASGPADARASSPRARARALDLDLALSPVSFQIHLAIARAAHTATAAGVASGARALGCVDERAFATLCVGDVSATCARGVAELSARSLALLPRARARDEGAGDERVGVKGAVGEDCGRNSRDGGVDGGEDDGEDDGGHGSGAACQRLDARVPAGDVVFIFVCPRAAAALSADAVGSDAAPRHGAAAGGGVAAASGCPSCAFRVTLGRPSSPHPIFSPSPPAAAAGVSFGPREAAAGKEGGEGDESDESEIEGEGEGEGEGAASNDMPRRAALAARPPLSPSSRARRSRTPARARRRCLAVDVAPLDVAIRAGTASGRARTDSLDALVDLAAFVGMAVRVGKAAGWLPAARRAAREAGSTNAGASLAASPSATSPAASAGDAPPRAREREGALDGTRAEAHASDGDGGLRGTAAGQAGDGRAAAAEAERRAARHERGRAVFAVRLHAVRCALHAASPSGRVDSMEVSCTVGFVVRTSEIDQPAAAGATDGPAGPDAGDERDAAPIIAEQRKQLRLTCSQLALYTRSTEAREIDRRASSAASNAQRTRAESALPAGAQGDRRARSAARTRLARAALVMRGVGFEVAYVRDSVLDGQRRSCVHTERNVLVSLAPAAMRVTLCARAVAACAAVCRDVGAAVGMRARTVRCEGEGAAEAAHLTLSLIHI